MKKQNSTPRKPPPKITTMLAFVVCLVVAIGMQAQAGPQVPLQGGDPERTGRSPYECPRSPTLAWTYSIGAGCSAAPVVAGDGTVYVGAYDKNLHAVSGDGTLAWRFQTSGFIKSGAGIGSDGSIYTPTGLGTLYATNPDGTSKWSSAFYAGSGIVGPTLIGSDGNIYVASENRKVYSVSPDGSQLWNYTLGVKLKYGVAASPGGGELYVPGEDGCVYALNSNGSFRWKSPNVSANNMCAVGDDGTIYVGGSDYKFYAINPNGTIKWSFNTYGKISAGAAVGLDGTIYFAAEDYRVYALRPDGTSKWIHSTHGLVYSAPTIDPFGTLVFGDAAGDLTALNAADGSLVWNFELGSSINASPVVARDGLIYVTDSSGTLSAFAGRVSAYPEPSSLAVVATAMAVWVAAWRRRR